MAAKTIDDEPHVCRICDAKARRYVGVCRVCKSTNTLVPDRTPRPAVLPSSSLSSSSAGTITATTIAAPWLVPSTDVAALDPERRSLGDVGLDRITGGGAARSSLILLAGAEGVGKSSLALVALATVAATSQARCILGFVEESPAMGSYRAKTLHAPLTPALQFARIANVEDAVRTVGLADLIVIDSGNELVDARRLAPALYQLRDALEHHRSIVIVLMQVNNKGELAAMRAVRHAADALLIAEHVDRRGRVVPPRRSIGRVRLANDGKNRFHEKGTIREVYYQRNEDAGGRLEIEREPWPTKKAPTKKKNKRTK